MKYVNAKFENKLRSKRKLRSWVVTTIVVVQFMLISFMGAEVDDLKLFIISKIFMLLLFMINSFILVRYSDIFDE